MKKLSLIAAAGLLGLSMIGAVTPSFAESIAACQDEVRSPNSSDVQSAVNADSGSILAALKDEGIHATSVAGWGGCVQASVVGKNGHVAQEYFDPSTLQRLSVNG